MLDEFVDIDDDADMDLQDDTYGGILVPPEFESDIPKFHLWDTRSIPVPFRDANKPQPTLEEVAKARGVTLLPEKEIEQETAAIRDLFDYLKARERRHKQIRKWGLLVVVVVATILTVMCLSV